MSSLIVMRGVPGSGKSRIARRIATAFGADYLSTDAIRAELTGDENSQARNAEVFPLLDARAEAALRAGRDVVIDATNVEAARMRVWLSLSARTGAELTVLRVDVPIATALARNAARARKVPEHVIHEMARQLEEPWE